VVSGANDVGFVVIDRLNVAGEVLSPKKLRIEIETGK
jgi:hypothetical protein